MIALAVVAYVLCGLLAVVVKGRISGEVDGAELAVFMFWPVVILVVLLTWVAHAGASSGGPMGRRG